MLEGRGYGRAADWWALGILIYEMTVGFPPFFSDTPFGVYRAILECNIRYPPGHAVPDRARSVVNGFVQPDRGTRLGCGENGFRDVKAHSFFKGIDFNSAARELLSPPGTHGQHTPRRIRDPSIFAYTHHHAQPPLRFVGLVCAQSCPRW